MTTTTSLAEQVKSRRIRIRKAAAALMLAGVLLCLCGCTRDEEASGKYRCTGAEAEGLELTGFPEQETVLTLEPDGRGIITVNGSVGNLTWTREEKALTLDMDGALLQGSIEDDEIRLTMDNGVVLRFERGEPRETTKPVPKVKYREWYGWWSIENSVGTLPDTWYDCCALLEQNEDGAELIVWDEDTDRDDPIARVQLCLSEKNGRDLLCTDYGWFLEEQLTEGQWTLETDQEQILLSGHYSAGSEEFDYKILLRPWGADWDLETERVPFHIFDWYLPLIEAGESMPDKIGS